MTETLNAFEIVAHGITGYYVAATRGRAKTLAARDLVDCGFNRNMGSAYKAIHCRRAPWRDIDADLCGREGALRET